MQAMVKARQNDLSVFLSELSLSAGGVTEGASGACL